MADWEERDRAEAAELYFCECADPECNEKGRLRGRDYERVRSESSHFFVIPGHEIPDVPGFDPVPTGHLGTTAERSPRPGGQNRRVCGAS